MTTQRSAGPPVALAVTLMALAGGIWRWHARVFHAQRMDVKGDSWDRVKQQYPLPPTLAEATAISPETADMIARANPFSPQRRAVSAPAAAVEGQSQGVLVPSAPKFLYKGRIDLGKRQRAIVEETTMKKTYFLEVGQDVAGFKVLDIAEDQVVLSDPQTHQEVVISIASKR